MTAPHGHRAPVDRRSFLARTIVGAATGSIAAALAPVTGAAGAAATQQVDAGSFAAFAESLELALVDAYVRIGDLVSGDVLPVIETYKGHHEQHAEVFAELAGDAATGDANAALVALLTPALDALSGQADALGFARTLEDQVVATYGYAASVLADRESAAEVASVLAVEASHAAALRTLLDEGPEAWFPDGPFEPTDIARGFAPTAFPPG